MTITKGTTVKSKLTGITGTVTKEVGNGAIFVRQDGTTNAFLSHETRWDEVDVANKEREHLEDYTGWVWKKGDFIRLESPSGGAFTATALADQPERGSVFFDVLSADGRLFSDLNFNSYSHAGGVKVLFRATVARGTFWE